MSLKELTAAKHAEAETTGLMKSVFAGTIKIDTWANFTWQKILFYGGIERRAKVAGYLDDLPGIERTQKLYNDFMGMTNPEEKGKHRYTIETQDYYRYISECDDKQILAHLYVWHMGDMFGGQMIKKLISAPHSSLIFEDQKTLMTNLRAKLDDSLGDEANVAFDWAIKIMRTYD
jgi:heme oxygenase